MTRQLSAPAALPPRLRLPFTSTVKEVRRSPLGVGALLVVVLVVLAAIFAEALAPFPPSEVHRGDRLQSPNAVYLLGTDASGRDLLSRIVHGSRVSLIAGVVPILLSGLIGTAIAIVSVYNGRLADIAIQRVMDTLMAFPGLLLAMVMMSLLGSSLRNIVIVVALVTVPTVNRVARSSTLGVLVQPYVEAARALGAGGFRISLLHVLPNIASPVLIVCTSLIGSAILIEAGLSFLGLGVQPPAPTWGNLLSGQDRGLFEVAPWLAVFPGLAITATVLASNLLGDALRDRLDPRSRRWRSRQAPR